MQGTLEPTLPQNCRHQLVLVRSEASEAHCLLIVHIEHIHNYHKVLPLLHVSHSLSWLASVQVLWPLIAFTQNVRAKGTHVIYVVAVFTITITGYHFNLCYDQFLHLSWASICQ